MNPHDSQSHPEKSNFEEITRILRSIGEDENSTDTLIPLVYQELHRIANIQFSRESPGHTMQPTALIHEAYLKLLDSSSGNWENRCHFFGAAAEAMRQILIDCARKKNAQKRGGKESPCLIDIEKIPSIPKDVELLDLNEALLDLEELDPEAAELVKLRFFSGLTMWQIADVLGVSQRTATNLWRFSQAWLYRRLKNE